MRNHGIDAHDRRLLRALQQDGRRSHTALSELVHLSASQCQRRLKRLERDRVITGYTAIVDREALGLDVMAFVHISLDKHGENPARAFGEAVRDVPEVLECWAVTGDADYVLRVVAPDLKRFSNFLLHRLLALPMVASVHANLLLENLKFTPCLPMADEVSV